MIYVNDMEGAVNGMVTAREVVSKGLGVGTWCGMGRREVRLATGILDISAAISRPIFQKQY